MSASILPKPCTACPYRRDVASGVWDASEYDKLPPYDAETFLQPFETFACHAATDHLCHGWALCHSNRGHDRELIALRLVGVSISDLPQASIELFSSGQEAAEHGRRDIDTPTDEAQTVVVKLLKRHARLRVKRDKHARK